MGIIPTEKDTNKIMHYITVGGLKQLEEKLTSPFIGNASLKSGMIKSLVGAVLPESGISGTMKEVFMIDGAEDIAAVIVSYVTGSFGSSENIGYV